MYIITFVLLAYAHDLGIDAKFMAVILVSDNKISKFILLTFGFRLSVQEGVVSICQVCFHHTFSCYFACDLMKFTGFNANIYDIAPFHPSIVVGYVVFL